MKIIARDGYACSVVVTSPKLTLMATLILLVIYDKTSYACGLGGRELFGLVYILLLF